MKTRIICLIILAILSILLFTGCTEVHQVSYNIGQEADNFNVTRRIVVYNARTDKLVFELIGNFSILNNTNNELEVVCEVENNIFKKHFVYLNEYTMYVVEDVSGAYVDKYHYEVNYIPEQIVPVTFTFKK
ncbi:MAG: hypothetical protein J6T10_24550 [Methanobrevibacter sp.]|nr:hypothetical protein [Methanobrevibacter sp.]